ncbi:CmpA/NrtA family ABC transporter substrate-binding protein, partial [Marinobacter sp. F3R11]|uniref:CmpA/NrtA family ABC transporter substrate-binding protein n=1 Tax=Marinobacter sp. F3R11 TaxID=2267231 RepID=UPI001C9E11DD
LTMKNDDPSAEMSGSAAPSHGSRCPCGDHSSMEEHRRELGDAMQAGAYQGEEQQIDRTVETTVLRSLFPDPMFRRKFLKAVGAGTALAAISQAFPLGVAQAMAKDTAPLEKTKLDIGFVPITCTIPLLLAQATGEYAKEGLDVNLIRTPGWSVARDNLVSGQYDASHMVQAMPLTMSLGAGSPKTPTLTSLIQNINGDALALHLKHKDKRNDPSSWKGFRFGIPHDHSVHAMLLRYYLAEHGLDPDKDVELRVYPPPDSVANMAADNLDGMLFAEPWNQRAVFEGVAFLQALSVDIFPNHPCCSMSVTDKFVTENPNTYGALFRAVARAGAFADPYENRQQVAELMAPREYLNQPLSVLQQVLLGRYADGLGNIVERRDRIGFKSFPYDSTAIWLLTQLKRWKIINADVDMNALAKEVFRSTDAARRMKDMGLDVPDNPMNKHIIMGKEFDPHQPEAYLNSFDIRRT